MKKAINPSDFALKNVPLRAIKGQALADFLTQHPCVNVTGLLAEVNQCIILKPWILSIDGSRTTKGVGAGIAITSPTRDSWKLLHQLELGCSNHQPEYESLINLLMISSERL